MGVAQIAVFVSGIAAYPFDTMQRRLQIEATKPKSEQIYNGMADCFGKILKAEGPGGFFKGALANILLELVPLSCSCSTTRSLTLSSACRKRFYVSVCVHAINYGWFVFSSFSDG